MKNLADPRKCDWSFITIGNGWKGIITNQLVDFDKLPEECVAYYTYEGIDLYPYLALSPNYLEDYDLTVVMFDDNFGPLTQFADKPKYNRYTTDIINLKYHEAIYLLSKQAVLDYKKSFIEDVLSKVFPDNNYPYLTNEFDANFKFKIPFTDDAFHEVTVETLENCIFSDNGFEGLIKENTTDCLYIKIVQKGINVTHSFRTPYIWEYFIYCDGMKTGNYRMLKRTNVGHFNEQKIINDTIRNFIYEIEEDFSLYENAKMDTVIKGYDNDNLYSFKSHEAHIVDGKFIIF